LTLKIPVRAVHGGAIANRFDHCDGKMMIDMHHLVVPIVSMSGLTFQQYATDGCFTTTGCGKPNIYIQLSLPETVHDTALMYIVR
jgi:hypothetical protein